jgi:hypothetical protein
MATIEGLPPGVAFLTITDYGFFPGTVATVNSIFHHHPGAEVIVVNRTQYGLTSPQRRLLEEGGVRVLDSDRSESANRHISPWEPTHERSAGRGVFIAPPRRSSGTRATGIESSRRTRPRRLIMHGGSTCF